MHLVFSTGEGADAYGWCYLVCKGKGSRVKAGEKNLWNPDVKIFWQRKAWVNNDVMRELARRFVEHKNTGNGADEWVIYSILR